MIGHGRTGSERLFVSTDRIWRRVVGVFSTQLTPLACAANNYALSAVLTSGANGNSLPPARLVAISSRCRRAA